MVKNVLLIIKTVGVIVFATKKIARSKKSIGMAKNNEERVFEVSQELDKMSRLICFKYDAGIHLPEAVIDWMTQEFICLYDADEDYPTLMPDEVITLRLMLRYIQREDL